MCRLLLWVTVNTDDHALCSVIVLLAESSTLALLFTEAVIELCSEIVTDLILLVWT